ncbi:hypothetical protein [Fretibacterium sp. OH1220_COT-178]|uniref:hypothetical protein n=1 Tax=Fretibacterium sp. OH1220_COT-178 TaxID=2491047 RepID=UPI000F601BDF|nr:hypothetical protein [Fretibacterium sp. OH1220_COT-178]RRD63083.1 hypothetical protein EII26_12615 [Fretibacterium sp. OH1220_COT-178]
MRIALWFQGGEQGLWPLSVLAVAAAVAFLLHIRRDRRAALALSIGVGVYELLNQGLYLYSFYFANEDPESLRRMLRLLTSGHWWGYRCLWLPLLTGGYLALRRNRRAWPLLCIGAAGALYQLADIPFLRYFLTYSPQYGELRFSTMTVFEAFVAMGYASAVAAFLFAYLDARSSRPVRFDELGSGELASEAVGGLPGASTLQRRLRRLLLASTILVCLNEFFGTGTLLSVLLRMTAYDSIGRTGTHLLACLLPCAAYLYSLAPFASPRVLVAYAYYEAFMYAAYTATAVLRAIMGESMMVAIGLGALYILHVLANVLLMVLFLAVLHTGRRLDERSRAAGAEESSLAWSAYAIAFLYPLADCISWVMTWADFRQNPGSLSLGATLPFLNALLVMLCLFLLPRRDRRSALAASAAAGASLLLSIATSILLWIPKVELRFWLLSPSWWGMRVFPALLIVGGYLALYRRRWAPLVLTASAAGALWALWGYVASLNPNSMQIDIRTTLVIFQETVPLIACVLAWCDRRSGGWRNPPIRDINVDMAPHIV